MEQEPMVNARTRNYLVVERCVLLEVGPLSRRSSILVGLILWEGGASVVGVYGWRGGVDNWPPSCPCLGSL